MGNVLADEFIVGYEHPNWIGGVIPHKTFFPPVVTGRIMDGADLDGYQVLYTEPYHAVEKYFYWNHFRDIVGGFKITGSIRNAGVPIEATVRCYEQVSDKFLGMCKGTEYGFENLSKDYKYYLVAQSRANLDLPAIVVNNISGDTETYESIVISLAPIVRFRLDEASGSTEVMDDYGRIGTVSKALLGKAPLLSYGKSALFESDDNYISSWTNLSLSKSFSISFWIKPNIAIIESYILTYGDDSTDAWEKFYFKLETDGSIVVSLHDIAKNAWVECSLGSGTISIDNVYHIAVTWDNVSGVLTDDLRMLINGSYYPFTSINDGGSKYDSTFSLKVSYSSLYLGMRSASHTINKRYNGYLDDVQIYDKKISDQNVIDLYEKGI